MRQVFYSPFSKFLFKHVARLERSLSVKAIGRLLLVSITRIHYLCSGIMEDKCLWNGKGEGCLKWKGMIVRGLLLHFAFIFQVLFPSCKAVCSNHNDCQYFSWQTWSVCYGGNPCSDSVKMRKRLFCCPNVVLKQTIERCLKHCNVTDPSEEFISIGPYCQNTSLSLQHICKGK